MRQKTTTTTLATLATIPLLLALLSGCSAGAEPDSTAGDATSARITDPTEWQLAYAKCMRSEGLDVADPGPDGSGTATTTTDTAGAYTAASKKCVAKIGEAPSVPGQEKQLQSDQLARNLAIAQCFRAHGVQMDDPTEDRISAIPSDAPADVVTACLGDGAQPAAPQGR